MEPTTALTSEQKELYRAGVLKLTEGQIEAAKRMAKKRKWTLERSILETVYLVYFGPYQREDVPRPTDDLAEEIVSDIPLTGVPDRRFDFNLAYHQISQAIIFASPAEIEQVKKILKIRDCPLSEEDKDQ